MSSMQLFSNENKKTFVWFEICGVMQSWGEHSVWGIRDTADWPTKSGISGLIGNAMGLEYEDPKNGEICENINFGVKAKKAVPIELVDYQTTDFFGGPLANGEFSDIHETIVQKKHYIIGRRYLVVIGGESELLNEIYHALSDPKRILYIGRKCCIPSSPIIPSIGYYEDMEDALTNIHLSDEELDKNEKYLYQMEVPYGEYGECRKDVRIVSNTKKYKERFVVTKEIC